MEVLYVEVDGMTEEIGLDSIIDNMIKKTKNPKNEGSFNG